MRFSNVEVEPMDTEELNELLDGPLNHPLLAHRINRLALALLHVVIVTGEQGAEALRDFCVEMEAKDQGLTDEEE